MSVVDLKGTEDLKSDAKKLLEEVISREYDSVVVVGYLDGKICINSSYFIHRHTFGGAIMDAALHVLNGSD